MIYIYIYTCMKCLNTRGSGKVTKSNKCMKSHKNLNCVLCIKERREIWKRWREDRDKLINDKTEMYGPCQCRTRFHRFTRTTASTDDGFNLERVGDTNLNSSTDYSVEDKNDDISVTSFLSDEEISENFYVYPMRD